MKIYRLLLLLLLGLPCFGQTHTFPALDTNNVFTGSNTFKFIDGIAQVSPGNPQGWSGSDPGAWINAAITAAAAQTSLCQVRVNPGVYASVTTYPINLAQDCDLDGTGATLPWTPSGAGNLFRAQGIQGWALRGFRISSNQTTGTNCVYVGGTTLGIQTEWATIEKVRIGSYFGNSTKGCDIGLFIDGTNLINGTYFIRVLDSMFSTNKTRGVVCSPTLGNQANQFAFHGGGAQGNGLDGVQSDGCTGISFYDFDSENNNTNNAGTVSVSSISRSGGSGSNIVSVTTSTAINCVAGDVVKIAGVSPSDYNSQGVPTQTCPTSTTFTYNQNFNAGVAGSGSGGTAQRTGCGFNFPGRALPAVVNSFRLFGGWTEAEGCDVAIGNSATVAKSHIFGLVVNNVAGVSGQVNGLGNDFNYGQGGSQADHFGPDQSHITAAHANGVIYSTSNDEANVSAGELVNIFQFSKTGTDAGTIRLGTLQYPLTMGGTFTVASSTSDPTGVAGMINYRSDLARLKFFDTAWHQFVGLDTADSLSSKNLIGPTIGSGSGINKALYASASLTFGAIAATGGCNNQTITVTGASTSAPVGVAFASPGYAIEAGLNWQAFVSATNTVTVRVCNGTAGIITPAASSTWATWVWQ